MFIIPCTFVYKVLVEKMQPNRESHLPVPVRLGIGRDILGIFRYAKTMDANRLQKTHQAFKLPSICDPVSLTVSFSSSRLINALKAGMKMEVSFCCRAFYLCTFMNNSSRCMTMIIVRSRNEIEAAVPVVVSQNDVGRMDI